MIDVLPCQDGERMGQPSFSPPPKKQRLHVYSWQCKVGCVFRRWLTICTTVFPQLITFWTRLMFNLVRVGKEWAGPVFPHPLTSNLMFYAYSGQGSLRLAEFFPTPLTICTTAVFQRDNLVHMVDVLPCQGGERMGRPNFSPSPKKQRLHVYSWQGKVGCVFPRRLTICTTVFLHPINFWTRLMFNLVRVGKEWASPVFPHPLTSNFRFYAYSWQGKAGWIFPHPINHMNKSFSPPDNLLHEVCLTLSGWGKTGPAQFFPTP